MTFVPRVDLSYAISMERPGLNPARSVTSIATAQQVPTEQAVYAEAMLRRQQARTAGKNTRELAPGMVTGDPPGDLAGLTQMGMLAFRQST
jgi:hypothetical protein